MLSGNVIERLKAMAAVGVFFLFAATASLLAADGISARQIPVTPPPMGWSSWNSFSNLVDSDIVIQQAKTMVSSGMQKAGYRYINIDEGWWLGTRDADGNIVVEPKRWPALKPGEQAGDMSNIVRYIHDLGLKAGIYTDAGADGCGYYGPDLGPKEPHTGSEGHYDQDFLQFAKWGFDYVKVDWCGGNTENLDPAVQYAAIAHAIARAERLTGHKLYYSICNWGNNSPWTWAPGVGGVTADIWRTSGDIVAPVVANSPNSGRKAKFSAVLSNFDHGIHPEAEHTGFYNDPDMMVIGMPGLSESQNRVHMSLWAISAAPLLVGADLSRLDQQTLGILINPEVIAVDQDTLGLQGMLVAQPAAGLQVWSKPLTAEGEHAVVLLNRTAAPARIAVKWSEIGLAPDSTAGVRDLWARKDLGTYSSAYSATVPAGDAVLLRIRGTEEKAVRYTADSRSSADDAAGRDVSFAVAPMQGPALVRIEYINHGHARMARLQVNGQIGTNVNFPSTGSGKTAGAITVEANLDQPEKQNRLSFSFPCTEGVDIRAIAVSGRHVEISPAAK